MKGVKTATYFRLTPGMDPEERLEEAALWKAMYDEFGSDIEPLEGNAEVTGNIYGRLRRHQTTGELSYWTDPAFLAECRREFHVCDFSEAQSVIDQIHARGKDAFVKATRAKFWLDIVPRGKALVSVMDGMEYSFIDGGPKLMVQEFVTMRYEWRFFVVGRKFVTDTPNAAHLTPIDYPCHMAFQTPQSKKGASFCHADKIRTRLLDVAERVAASMKTEDAVIDCAEINGVPGCVELNPMIIGQVGLFASDVRALARACKQSHPRLAIPA